VLEAASENSAVGKLLRELQEPRPAGQDCIPWLGETAMKERILRLCARGKIAINLRNLEHLQAHAGEDEDTAWRRLRPKLSYTGRQLDEVFLMEPSAVPATGGTTPPAPQPLAGATGGLSGDILAAVPCPLPVYKSRNPALRPHQPQRQEVFSAARAAPTNRASRSLTRPPLRSI